MSVTKTVHSQTAPGPAEASSCCGHSWHRQAPRPKLTFLGPYLAGSWGVFLKFWQRTLPDTTSWAPSPAGAPVRACVRACGGFALQVLSRGMALSAAGQSPQLSAHAQAPSCYSRQTSSQSL